MQQNTKPKGLGFWLLTALVSGNMIGSGVFLVPAALARYGSIGIIAWLATAFGALSLALVFAKLSYSLPKAGGPYAYCRAAYGEFIGFEVAYIYWMAAWIGNAAVAVALTSYLEVFLPGLASNPWYSFLVSAGAVWFLTLVNILGVRLAAQLQLVTTLLKLIPLLLIAFIGVWHIQPQYLDQFNVSGHSNFTAFVASAALTLWTFIGVESATVPADDVIEPQKTIPRATIAGTLLAATVYLLSAVAVMGSVPLDKLAGANAPYALAAFNLFGPIGEYLVAFGAVVACFGALNGWILLQGQIPMAAADDDAFLSIFSKRSKQGTPIVGLLISASLMTGLLLITVNKNLVEQFTTIILLAVTSTLVVYLLSAMAQLILGFKNPALRDVLKNFAAVCIAGLAFFYSYWALIGAGQQVVYYGTLLFFSGVPIYVWLKAQQ